MGYKNLSASRGDGNLQSHQHLSPIQQRIRTYLPREGTETLALVLF